MKDKFIYLFITCFSLFILYLLLYFLNKDGSLYMMIFSYKINISYIVALLYCSFFIIFLLLIKEKQKNKIVAKIIKNEDKIIFQDLKKLQEKLYKEQKFSQKKDKLILQSHKIPSYMKKSKISVFRLFTIKHQIISHLNLYEKDIEIMFEIKEDISVRTYLDEIIYILENIINNSFEVFERNNIKDKKIDIKMDFDDTHFSISVKDNGGGISEEIIDRVFEPFFSTKDQADGLGLYFVYLLVREKLRGEVGVVNSGDGCEVKMKMLRLNL